MSFVRSVRLQPCIPCTTEWWKNGKWEITVVVRDGFASQYPVLFSYFGWHIASSVCGLVFFCVYVHLWAACKLAKDKAFHCGQMHTLLSHYCLLVRCDKGKKEIKNETKREGLSEPKDMSELIIWYPICWVTHTPVLLPLSPSPFLILSSVHLTLSALCLSFLELLALANFCKCIAEAILA